MFPRGSYATRRLRLTRRNTFPSGLRLARVHFHLIQMRVADRQGALGMKILSQCTRRRDDGMLSAVFVVKMEIPD